MEFIQTQAKFLRQSGFDSVRIFCTQYISGDDEETMSVDAGLGNFQAQLGQIRQWLIRMDQYTIEDTKQDCRE